MSKLRAEKNQGGAVRPEKSLYDYGRGLEWNSLRLRVAIGFPAPYRAGMSNLGFLWVYHLLNMEDGVRCDRFFLPDPDEGGKARISTIETGRPISQYDVVAFSLPYERDYPQIVRLLRGGGVEPFASKRHCDPLVIAGGVAVGANPEPVAEFFDAIVIGEAESVVAPIIEAAAGCGSGGGVLEELRKIPGVYAPSFYTVEYKNDGTVARITPDAAVEAVVKTKIEEPAHSPIVAEGAAFKNMFLVEMSRGCPHRCRFCLTRYSAQGFRAAPEEALLAAVGRGLSIANRVGLIGTAFAHAGSADAVCREVSEAGGRLSFSSLRMTDRVSEIFSKWGSAIDNETLSIAPEVATDKLRRVLDKDMEKSLERFLDGDIPGSVRALKLYYLAGVPGEEEPDIDAIIEEALRVREKAAGRGISVSLSVNPLVPKAHTPLQWMRPAERNVVKARTGRIRRSLAGHGVKVGGMGAREAEIQTMLSLGDRRLAAVIADAAGTGCTASDYETALKRHGLSMGFYSGRARSWEETLPWSVVSHGAERAGLWEQYRESAAMAGAAV